MCCVLLMKIEIFKAYDDISVVNAAPFCSEDNHL